MNEQIIKSIVPTQCPHCHADILVEFDSHPAKLSSVLKPADLAAAKEEARKRLAGLSVPEELKTTVREWINDENTVFGPSEIDAIIASVIQGNAAAPKN